MDKGYGCMDYDKGGTTKHDPSGAKVVKYGGNEAIHDGKVSAGPSITPKAGAYEKGKGKLAEGPE